MCDCIALVDAKLKADYGAQLDLMLSLSGGPHTVAIHSTLIEKKRGQRAPFISAAYCPFCGEKYGGQEASP